MTPQEKQALAKIALLNKNTKEGQKIAKIITAEKVKLKQVKPGVWMYKGWVVHYEQDPMGFDTTNFQINFPDGNSRTFSKGPIKNIEKFIQKEIDEGIK